MKSVTSERSSSINQRGVALMLVLWLIVVLGVIAAAVVALSRSQTNLVQTMRSRTVARYAAESGVVAATLRLKEMVGSARGPDEQVRAFRDFEEELMNWGERSLGSARYQVAVTDLNARVDLNNSSEELLLGLFEQFFGANEATALVNALRDWVDDDDEALPDGAEAADYVGAGSPFLPPNGPIQRLDELTRIRGFSDSIAGVIAPYVTVWSDGRVNVNSAPLPVLAAAPELGPSGAEMLVAARERGDVLASKIVLSSRLREAGRNIGGQLSNLTTVPGYILIVSRGWEDGRPLTHEIQAVFQVHGLQLEDGPRLQVRYWTERDL
ncbi:MAG: general secretion pathway protein GspK [Gemmatimonadota bacterium]|nr:MAG: general secretion pathway protein GspK [Gemmatimonadota bacterium]